MIKSRNLWKIYKSTIKTYHGVFIQLWFSQIHSPLEMHKIYKSLKFIYFYELFFYYLLVLH